MKKKYFISSDIHGFFDQWMSALERNGFDINDDSHIIVVLGDLLDRGKKPKECLDFVNNLPSKRKVLIRGNHEDLLMEAINRRYFGGHDYSNGTFGTVYAVTGLDSDLYNGAQALGDIKHNKDWVKYYNSTIDYYEVGDNIFVHGWIPCKGHYCLGDIYNPEFDENWRNGDWNNARWSNGMKLWSKGIKVPDKTIWCGHWNSSWGWSHLKNIGLEWGDEYDYPEAEVDKYAPRFIPFEDDGIVAMDSSCAWSDFLNCKVLEIED